MRAVLLIFGADTYLMETVSPYINFENETIYWEKIQHLPLGSGHKNALRWPYAVWTDESPKADSFYGALAMGPVLKTAVLKALVLRWELTSI